jgi:hypothetical protein
LTHRGLRTVPSYEIFDVAPDRLTREQVEQAVRRSGVQAAIVARVSRLDKETRGGGGFSPAAGNGGYVVRFQQEGAASYNASPTNYQYDVVTVDVELYDVAANQLVWTGVTRTFDPSNLESSTRDWAKVDIEAMAQRALL